MPTNAQTILSSCSDYQAEIAKTITQPLMVSAGAGSGKTFTLTQRIAYGFCEQEETGTPFLSDIDEIIAITFTEKAAAELKSRFKAKLLDMGLTEQALKVDDARVSTIHGMCSRILRENAFAFGLDPAFEIVQGADEQAYKYEAFKQTLSYAKAHPELIKLNTLISTQKLYKSGDFDSSDLSSMANALLDRVNTTPRKFDNLEVFEPSSSPSEILRKLILLGEEYRQLVEPVVENGKAKDTDKKHFNVLLPALEQAYSVLDSFDNASFADEDFDASSFATAVFAFPLTTAKYKCGKETESFFQDYRTSLTTLFEQAEAGCDYNNLLALIQFTKLYEENYEAVLGPSNLDNSMLLSKTYKALSEHPEITQGYQDHFKLIMVDEFQDTDLLQVAIIELLAKPDGSNICTVGDAQQSIYRFRGADVNVFFNYREQLKKNNEQAKLLQLPDNFRSHAEVLSLVEEIFSLEQVFGNDFLKLNAKGSVNDKPNSIFADQNRIKIHLCETRAKKSNLKDASILAAQKIAQDFAELRDKHAVSPGEMVILFGSMKKAEIYANELTAKGFECVFTGGSLFKESPEVAVICSAINYAANPNNAQALLELLTSDLFNLTDASILALSSPKRREYLGQDSIHDLLPAAPLKLGRVISGFATLNKRYATRLSQSEIGEIARTKACLAAYIKDCQNISIVDAIRNLFVNAGLIIRYQKQGVQGLASAGNLLKALEYLEEIAPQSTGLSSLAKSFSSFIAGLKETPGVLSTTQSNYVRLMTIHSSKGLQFPHVAVAEIGSAPRPSSLAVENILGTSYIYFNSSVTGLDHNAVTKLQGWREDSFEGVAQEVIEAKSASERKCALFTYVKNQECNEKQRLFYVALTRAVESLSIALAYEGNKAFDYSNKLIVKDLFAALNWEASESAPEQVVPFGPYKASLTLSVLNEHLEGFLPEAENNEFLIPTKEPAPATKLAYQHKYVFRPERVGMFSYSALPHEEQEDNDTDANDLVVSNPGYMIDNSVASDSQANTAVANNSDSAVNNPSSTADNLASYPSTSLDPGAFIAAPITGEDWLKGEAAPRMSNRLVPVDSFSFGDEYEDPNDDSLFDVFFDEDFIAGGDAAAVSLGSAFHRIAQYAIEIARQNNDSENNNQDATQEFGKIHMLVMPEQSVIQSQIKQWGVSPEQRIRLQQALDYWFNSQTANEFACHSEIAAEVPFLVAFTAKDMQEIAPDLLAQIANEKRSIPSQIYLEGEIDGLATDENDVAYLIDYKTGGHADETPEQLHAKHILQATCYAYALLTEGYKRVEAKFVRVEQQQIVPYTFTQAELPNLKETIITSYLKGVLRNERD